MIRSRRSIAKFVNPSYEKNREIRQSATEKNRKILPSFAGKLVKFAHRSYEKTHEFRQYAFGKNPEIQKLFTEKHSEAR